MMRSVHRGLDAIGASLRGCTLRFDDLPGDVRGGAGRWNSERDLL